MGMTFTCTVNVSNGCIKVMILFASHGPYQEHKKRHYFQVIIIHVKGSVRYK